MLWVCVQTKIRLMSNIKRLENRTNILIIPPSEHTANWYDMKVDGWVDGIINQLQKYTDRPIRVRYKYENKGLVKEISYL